MKKIIPIIITMLLVLGLCSCDPGQSGNSNGNSLSPTSAAETETTGEGEVKETEGTDIDALTEQLLLSSPQSYQSLYNELKAHGFREEQAKQAADNCGADWNEQAADAAEQYLKKSDDFTEEGLKTQLKYDGFTDEQAEYGAEKALDDTAAETTAPLSDKEDLIRSYE